MPRIHTQSHRQLDRLREAGGGHGVQGIDGPRDIVSPRSLPVFSRLPIASASVCRGGAHEPVTSIPIERAVPVIMFVAASISVAFKSGSFVRAMSRHWSRVKLATLFRLGSAEAVS